MAPKFNSKLAWAAYHEAEKDQEHWWQGTWRAFFARPTEPTDDGIPRCGTTYCFGGWAAHLDRGRWLVGNKKLAVMAEALDDDSPDLGMYLLARKDEPGAITLEAAAPYEDYSGKRVVDVGTRAANVLGLTYYEKDYLFDSQRTLPEIKAALEKIENARATGLTITLV